jgi:hypothetical protein
MERRLTGRWAVRPQLKRDALGSGGKDVSASDVAAKEMANIRRFWDSIVALHAKQPYLVVTLATRDESATAAASSALLARGFEAPIAAKGRWWAWRTWFIMGAKRVPSPLTQEFMATTLAQAVEAGTASNTRYDGAGAAPQWPRSAA